MSPYLTTFSSPFTCEVATNRQFDPWEHEVVSYEETAERPEGHVVGVVREGYKLHGKVLRPALVTVAKSPQTYTAEESAAPQVVDVEKDDPSQEGEA